MSLVEYNKKREFRKTAEPKGNVTKTSAEKALVFVVQRHAARRLHYDFRLELDGVLKSWAVPKGPSMNPGDKRLAIMTEDHPLSYADFEGEIPKGEYGAGEVELWDRGVYLSDKTADKERSRRLIKSGIKRGELGFVLLGERLKGKFTLVRMKDRGENAWLLIKADDDYATQKDVTREEVRKGKAKKKKDPMPHKIKPMLATLIDEPFDRKGWYFEIKWDGYRAIAELKNGRVTLYSRNGRSFNEAYPPIVSALKKIKHDCVLDGEIIAQRNGRADFHALQEYKETAAPLQYVLFDLLYLDGRDLREIPLKERKGILRDLLHPLPDEALLFSEHIEDKGKYFFKKMDDAEFEGMIAKDSESPYREGVRRSEWLKVKRTKDQEAIIIGFTKPRGSRKYLGALVLGAHDAHGDLRYIGHSGGGFSTTELRNLHSKLSKISEKRSPVDEKVPINSPITWVKPTYVCEVTFSEWTRDGRMRQPIYKGLRTDKGPQEVSIEHPQENVPENDTGAEHSEETRVTLTNVDKIFWREEGYTKGDVIAYYDAISDIILPYLRDRPQNLNRHPNGIEGKHFYHKNVTMDLPSFVETVEVWSESNQKNLRYVVCNNKETLLFLANLGCIELNPWNSRTSNLEEPDYMILDLDPNGRPFEDLITVAKEVRKILDTASVESYPKTSGKTGIHIVIPLDARYSYDETRDFAEIIMRITATRVPSITSVERSPKKRPGRIYLDYLQNRFAQTLAAPYSLRPYTHATVSTPLTWSEVRKGLDPSRFTIQTIHKRIEKKGDLFLPVLGKGADLSQGLRFLEKNI